MQYREDKKSGRKLSVLGLGCMRFSKNLGNINIEKAENTILSSIENGINYFDTAWMYRGSEEALGSILERNRLRDRVYIASKLPAMLINKQRDFDHFFNEQLKRLRTDHIDYYLIHNLADLVSWEYLAHLGIEEWIAGKKRDGAIGQIGFSFHGTADEFLKILSSYSWELCQIQYNYSDENYQAGVKGLKKAAGTMPVIVMEPLLGGKLANNLPKAAEEIFEKAPPPRYSPAGWGLRWLWNQEEVTVVLSGMNDPRQVAENAALAGACNAFSLSAEDLLLYNKVREVFNSRNKIPCTGCAYCMPCPYGVNIPGCLAAYNTSYIMGFGAGLQQYMMNTSIVSAHSSSPLNCTACRKCETRCPQKIPIVESLKLARKRMEFFPLGIGFKAVRAFMAGIKKKKPDHLQS